MGTKRLIKILILIFLLLFTMLLLPNKVNAFTYDGINYNIFDEDTVEVSGYDGTPIDLIIPETVEYGGTEYTVTAIGDYAFRSCTSLKTIELPKTVTSIGIAAFDYCSNLTTINLSDKITKIEKYAFNECTSLKNVQIPNSIKSIGERTFYNCIGLETIIIPETLESLGEEAFLSYSYTNATRKTIILNPELVFSGPRQFSWIIKIYGFKDTATENFAIDNRNEFEAFYSVKNSLNNITCNGLSYAHSVLGDYKATLSAEESYKLPENIEINANGNILEEDVDYTYDKSNGNILIYGKSINGDIEIIASGVTLISNVEITGVTNATTDNKDEITNNNNEASGEKDETPSTGNIVDGISLQLYVLSIISLTLVFVIKKLRKNK